MMINERMKVFLLTVLQSVAVGAQFKLIFIRHCVECAAIQVIAFNQIEANWMSRGDERMLRLARDEGKSLESRTRFLQENREHSSSKWLIQSETDSLL